MSMVERTTSPVVVDASVLLDALAIPAFLIDSAGRIASANRAAEVRFGTGLAGELFVRRLRHPDVLSCIEEARAGRASEREVTLPQPVRTTYRIAATALQDGSDNRLVLFTLQDISLLIEAEQMRSDFVANVSHELRSPLATLLGAIETLQGPARDDATARTRFLGVMQAEAERMNRLIDDLLSLSRIEVREHVRPSGSVDLDALLARVIAAAGVKAGSDMPEIRLEGAEDAGSVTGEEDELAEVFHNLIDNAVKYGEPGAPVIVTVRTFAAMPGLGAPGVSVEVRDRGAGIASEEIPRLTERFYRVDKARSRQKGGTGLGLAIVKHILKRHRGRLAIASKPGQGSSFTVSLPRG